jgi:hypothetical protein
MKKIYWALIALFPIAAHCSWTGEDLITINEHGCDALLHFAYEDEEEVDFLDTPELAFLEMEESSEALLPWASEKFAERGISILDEEIGGAFEEFEDEVFSYTTQGYEAQGNCMPTLEKVPDGRKQLFGRPKVVPSSRPKEEREEKKVSSKKGQLVKAGEKS